MLLAQDFRYAIRALSKKPDFTAVVVLTLALGIGACTVVFSLVYGLVFRPHAVDRDGRLMVVFQTNTRLAVTDSRCRYEDFVDWREQSSVFDALAAYRPESLNLAGAGEPVRVRAIKTSADIFDVLSLQPVKGRLLDSQDDQPGADQVAVVSDAFWKGRLGADPTIVGRNITIHGDVYRVVGVAPSDFDPARRLLPSTDVWLPLGRSYDRTVRAGAAATEAHDLRVLGRRRAGVSLSEVATELDAIAGRLEQAYPESNSGWGTRVKTAQRARLGDGGELALKFLVVAVAFVLLIVCFNVANLLLARAASRGKEMALRSALGASRGRLARQLLVESAVIALIAGGAGALMAMSGVQGLFALSSELQDVEISHHPIQVDGLALAFSLGTALATVAIFGLFPALRTSNCNVSDALKEGSRRTRETPRGHRLRGALVTGQIAVAIVLVVSTSLVVQSLFHLRNLDPGYDPHGLLAANISLPESTYPNEHQWVAFYERALAEIEQLPEVTSVAASDSPPLSLAAASVFSVEGRRVQESDPQPETAVSTVTTGYFPTMKVSLTAGRDFAGSDDADAPAVALINETLALRYFPGEDAVGQRLKLGRYDDSESEWRNIVGILRDNRRWAQDHEIDPQVFVPYKQNPRSRMVVVARTTLREPQKLGGAVRQSVWRVDPDQPVYDIRGMEEAFNLQFSSWHVFAGLLIVFCVVALTLAAVGTYGSMSYMVSQRTHEIGVRIALGAQIGDVLRLVLRRGVVLTTVGIGLGVPTAIGVARLLSNILYRVTALHGPTLIGVALLLTAVALLACYVPARRAARLDPMVTLRCE